MKNYTISNTIVTLLMLFCISTQDLLAVTNDPCADSEDYIVELEKHCADIRQRNWEQRCSAHKRTFQEAYDNYRNAGCFNSPPPNAEACRILKSAVDLSLKARQRCEAEADQDPEYQECLRDVEGLRRFFDDACSNNAK